MSIRPLATLALVAVVAVLAACEPKVTPENFEQITEGMTIAQVEKILGPGEEEAAAGGTSIGGSGMLEGARANAARTFIWKEDNRQIIVVFQDGKVVNKYSMGF
jgi:hypothetical protein